MKTLIYIEDVFEGSFTQFQDCFFSFGEDPVEFTKEIEDNIADWCRTLDFNLMCIAKVSDEQWEKMERGW